jgi:hypothetical protein
VAIIVAILLAGGVLLGFLALVVDMGQIYAEREELQSGSDAAALAVANACAHNAAGCADFGAIRDLAQRYADLNSADGRSHIAEICGLLPGKLNPCDPPLGNLTDCLGTPPASPAPYVQVRLSTENGDGTLLLPATFARAAGVAGADVAACARAAWTSTAQVPILAVSISVCEFNSDTADGTVFGDALDPDRHDEKVVNWWVDAYDRSCFDPPSTLSQAALLDGGGSTCTRTMPADGRVTGVFGVPEPLQLLSPTCEARVDQARSDGVRGNVVYIPVHDSARPQASGSKIDFHEIGLAPFLVTGYQLGPAPPFGDYARHRKPSTVSGDDACSLILERCVSGIFTGALVPLSGIAPGGNTIVTLIG